MGNADSKPSDGHVYAKMTPAEYRRYKEFVRSQSLQGRSPGTNHTPQRTNNVNQTIHVTPPINNNNRGKTTPVARVIQPNLPPAAPSRIKPVASSTPLFCNVAKPPSVQPITNNPRRTYEELHSERHYQTNTTNYQHQPRMKPNLQQKHAMSDMKNDYESICQQRQHESNRQYLHTMHQHGNDTSDFHERDFQRRQQELDMSRKQMHSEPSTERTGEYRRILDKFSRETDPYILLEVSRDTPTREVTRKYRRLARQVHPDRGGNREDFDRLTKAYLCILEEGKRKETESTQASHQNMQQHFGEYTGDQSTGSAPLGEGSEFNHELFHKIYRENRLDDPYDTGYSAWIKESGKGSTDIEPIFSDGFNLKVFNAAFREKKELASHQRETEIVEYVEPSAALQTTGVGYTELGQDDVRNFTKQKHDSGGQLAYCDYKEAMTDTHLIDPTQIKSTRTEYRDLEHCEKDRESISYTMTDEARQQHQYLMDQEQAHEVNRKDRLYAHDQKIQTKYNQVHTQLTGDTPNYMLQS